jgi:hypothetical protein
MLTCGCGLGRLAQRWTPNEAADVNIDQLQEGPALAISLAVAKLLVWNSSRYIV